ncbi:MAG TPA: hypothetical protein VF773_23190 [Verrucomicrobiae bacterium]
MNQDPIGASQPAYDPPFSPREVQGALKAARFAGVMFLLVLSYFALRLSLSMGSFKQIFADMLEGKALPLVSYLVLRAQPLLIALCVSIPIAAISTLFWTNLRNSFLLLGWAALVSLILVVLLCEGLTAPLIGLIDQLGGAPVVVE